MSYPDMCVGRAQAALNTYGCGEEVEPERVVDLLADLHHWCDAHDISMGDVMLSALMHFNAEESQ